MTTARSRLLKLLGIAALQFIAALILSGAALGFTPGNIVVCRVGDGINVLGQGATPVFIDEYSPAGVLVSSIAMPVNESGANARLTVGGVAAPECEISRSIDGRFILVPGYNAPVGMQNLAASSSATTPRVVGRIDRNGMVDTRTSMPDALDGGSIRGVVSTDGTDIWISGNGFGGNVSPIRYVQFGSTTSTPVAAASLNLRGIGIFDGQLFASAATGSVRIGTVGTGLPSTSGQALNALPGVPTTLSVDTFFLADLDSNIPGVDTLYLADEVGSIRKFSFNGSAWVAKGAAALSGVAGLTASVSGTTVTLYVTNAGSLQRLIDTGGHDGNINGFLTPIATPSPLTAFRGVALAPVAQASVVVDWGLRSHTRRVAISAGDNGMSVNRIYFKLPYMNDFQFVEGNSARFKVIKQNGSWNFEAFVEDAAGNRTSAVTYSTQ